MASGFNSDSEESGSGSEELSDDESFEDDDEEYATEDSYAESDEGSEHASSGCFTGSGDSENDISEEKVDHFTQSEVLLDLSSHYLSPPPPPFSLLFCTAWFIFSVNKLWKYGTYITYDFCLNVVRNISLLQSDFPCN